MPAKRKSIPSYLLHAQSGRARAVWTDQTGTRQFRLLPGAFDSAESRTAFGSLLLELEAAPHLVEVTPTAVGPSVAEVLLAFLAHATRHYHRDRGEPSSELRECKLVVKALRELYADLPAAEFGPLKLKAVRQGWVNARLARSECNRRANLVRRIFKWAAAEELVPPGVYQGLTVVGGLQQGRTQARETAPVVPVDAAVVDATLPHLNRHVRGLVEFQRLTGCRPGEGCVVRMCDVDTSGPVWVFKPTAHKSAWRGKVRAISIGPKAQDVLRAFLTPDPGDYLFSPIRAVGEVHAARSAGRKTPRYPSHLKRNQTKRTKAPSRVPTESYDASSYAHAVARACDRAFPPPEPLGQRPGESLKAWWGRLSVGQRAEVKRWQTVHRWQPNQLRHSFATRVRKDHGLEAAQVLLGHARADVTQVYAERDDQLAAAVAAVMG